MPEDSQTMEYLIATLLGLIGSRLPQIYRGVLVGILKGLIGTKGHFAGLAEEATKPKEDVKPPDKSNDS